MFNIGLCIFRKQGWFKKNLNNLAGKGQLPPLLTQPSQTSQIDFGHYIEVTHTHGQGGNYSLQIALLCIFIFVFLYLYLKYKSFSTAIACGTFFYFLFSEHKIRSLLSWNRTSYFPKKPIEVENDDETNDENGENGGKW